jgi:hypothetical protein
VHVKERNITGLKSHDNHIILQDLLPLARLGAEIAETLSLVEAIFLPSFFDIMVHLMIHLPAQAMIAGPVHFSSMWATER